ncbi:MAG: TetR/AcrR family transcriptional regulator [Verrucomicrobiota bacterium]
MSDKRKQILETANRLFEAQGFNGTGVDQISQESGVTKRTLYKQFGSKEGLIKEVLVDHHARMFADIRSRILTIDGSARDRLMACFEYYFDWFRSSRFCGCIFIKTLNELGGCSTELGCIAQNAKDTMRAFIARIAEEGGFSDPQRLAVELQLLLEGSIVLAQAGNVEAVQVAKEVAGLLIENAEK